MSKGNQLARQWQLLRILESFRFGIGIEELAGKVGYCRRTIERDLELLSETGFPISCEQRDYGRKFWRLESNFLESDKLLITPTEMVSMHLAKQCLMPLAGTCFGQGFEQLWGKIKTLLPQKALNYFSDLEEKFYVKSYYANNKSSEAKHLETINKAMNENAVLRIIYKPDADGPSYKTEYYPYGLVLYEGSMYVIGYSLHSKAVRTFKVKRLSDVEITKKTFQRPEDFSLEHCVSGSFGIIYKEIKPITVRCEFRDWAARLMREQKWHRTQVIEKDSGDKLVVSFLLDATTEFKRWILGFGPLARILEPKNLKDEITILLKQSLENYQKR